MRSLHMRGSLYPLINKRSHSHPRASFSLSSLFNQNVTVSMVLALDNNGILAHNDTVPDSFQSEKSSQNHTEEEDKIWPEDAAPPSYDSLFGQIKEAKETSDGSFDFCKRVVQLFAGTSKLKELSRAVHFRFLKLKLKPPGTQGFP